MTHVVIGLVMVPVVWAACALIESIWRRRR